MSPRVAGKRAAPDEEVAEIDPCGEGLRAEIQGPRGGWSPGPGHGSGEVGDWARSDSGFGLARGATAAGVDGLIVFVVQGRHHVREIAAAAGAGVDVT